jgi:hypothetical protein
MRCFLTALAGALLLTSAPGFAVGDRRAAGEAQLAEALSGRVAGTPVDCLSMRNIRSSRIINGTAIIYDVGGTKYVNRPEAGQESLRSWDVLVTRTHSDRLCSIDVVHLYDQGSQMQKGTVFLGQFVPYTRNR